MIFFSNTNQPSTTAWFCGACISMVWFLTLIGSWILLKGLGGATESRERFTGGGRYGRVFLKDVRVQNQVET